MDNDILVIVVVVAIMAMVLGYVLTPVFAWLKSRPKHLKLETRDMTSAFFKKRLRTARATKRNIGARMIICVADDETEPVRYRRLVGVVRDTRCSEFFVRLNRFQIRPNWFIIPSWLVESWLNPNIVLLCREFRNMGAFYVPVLSSTLARKVVVVDGVKMSMEEALKRELHAYTNNLWLHEQRQLIAEKTTDGMFDAIAPLPMLTYLFREPGVVGSDEGDDLE